MQAFIDQFFKDEHVFRLRLKIFILAGVASMIYSAFVILVAMYCLWIREEYAEHPNREFQSMAVLGGFICSFLNFDIFVVLLTINPHKEWLYIVTGIVGLISAYIMLGFRSYERAKALAR